MKMLMIRIAWSKIIKTINQSSSSYIVPTSHILYMIGTAGACTLPHNLADKTIIKQNCFLEEYKDFLSSSNHTVNMITKPIQNQMVSYLNTNTRLHAISIGIAWRFSVITFHPPWLLTAQSLLARDFYFLFKFGYVKLFGRVFYNCEVEN